MGELTKADEIMIEMDYLTEDLKSLYTVRKILYDRQEWNAYYPVMNIIDTWNERYDALEQKLKELRESK